MASSPQSSVEVETPQLTTLLVTGALYEDTSMFKPFDCVLSPSEGDTQMWDHLVNTQLFEDIDADATLVEVEHFPWPSNNKATAWRAAPGTHSMRSIWEKYADGAPWWDRFEPYLQEDENDFDPTLQNHYGVFPDHDTDRLCSTTHPAMELVDDDQEREWAKLQSNVVLDLISGHGAGEAYRRMEDGKKKQVCRHFLAGECFRKDCWFTHDVQVKMCKFWLQGSCLKGDLCEYPHGLVMQVASADKVSSPEVHGIPVTSDGAQYPMLRNRRKRKVKKDGSARKPIKESHAEPAPITLNNQEDFPLLMPVTKAPSASTPCLGPNFRNFADVAKTRKKSTAPQKRLANLLQRPVHTSWLESGGAPNAEYLKQRIDYSMLRNRALGDVETGEDSRRIKGREPSSGTKATIDLHGVHMDYDTTAFGQDQRKRSSTTL
ncbi:hypothetical protein DFQ30_005655 [Apophysomyces sp. BC1015]|nr:hypothetical protein DFQ30_005655 [Apophysomyces sp. BC1015]KAG0170522.1 hypothetical protein DFQ29_009220 [Apophysomyces sp. BC1021]